MKRNYFVISISLLVSLFIYMFYRTEKTLINKIFIAIISQEQYTILRERISNSLLLNQHIIYSLPEGLWILCISLTSRSLFVKIGNCEFSLFIVPIVFSIGLEFLQLLHITNGRFDFWDIGVSIICWGIANFLIANKSPRQNMLHPFNTRSMICLLSYLIIYLAHV